MRTNARLIERLRQSLSLFVPPTGKDRGSLAKHPPKRVSVHRREPREAKTQSAPP